MKNVYFTLKSLRVLKIFVFSTLFLTMQENSLIRKTRLTTKCLTPQTGKQVTKRHIFLNTSRHKDNQAMKFGQLIECNRNNFLGKSYTKSSQETSTRPFSEKLNLSISSDQQCELSSWGLLKYLDTKVLTNGFYLI